MNISAQVMAICSFFLCFFGILNKNVVIFENAAKIVPDI
jgi:hypothetical protein